MWKFNYKFTETCIGGLLCAACCGGYIQTWTKLCILCSRRTHYGRKTTQSNIMPVCAGGTREVQFCLQQVPVRDLKQFSIDATPPPPPSPSCSSPPLKGLWHHSFSIPTTEKLAWSTHLSIRQVCTEHLLCDNYVTNTVLDSWDILLNKRGKVNSPLGLI